MAHRSSRTLACLAGCTAADRALMKLGRLRRVEPVRRSLTVCLDSIVSRKSVRLLWKPRRHWFHPVGKSVLLTQIAGRLPIPQAIHASSLWASGTLYPNQLGGLGETCGLTIDCEEPFVCNGVCGICTGSQDDASTDLDDCATVVAMPGITEASFEGARDLGEPCDYPLGCRRPLVCGLDKTCQKLPDFASAACSRSGDERGAFRVYFETQQVDNSSDDREFYRLPSPSDLRTQDSGSLNFVGHGGPGQVLGMDFPEDYLGPAGDSVEGFALNVPVFFRLSDYVTTESICLDPENDSYPTYVEPIGGAVFRARGR